MSGKPGRPPEDRPLRQREIYEAVAPLILTVGARRLTMRQAATAACLSLGGLNHYFPSKRDLLLHPFQPGAFERLCQDFHAAHGYLESAAPRRFLDAYIDFHVQQVVFIRPAVHAALELGAETFWAGMENGLETGLNEFCAILKRVAPTIDDSTLEQVGKAVRRILLSAVLDRRATPEELRQDLHALIKGYSGGEQEDGHSGTNGLPDSNAVLAGNGL